MTPELINLLTQTGFAGLFVWLLIYVLKENSKREERYLTIIKSLSNELPKIRSGIEKINTHLGIEEQTESDQ